VCALKEACIAQSLRATGPCRSGYSSAQPQQGKADRTSCFGKVKVQTVLCIERNPALLRGLCSAGLLPAMY
jgi:hypothetical protein